MLTRADAGSQTERPGVRRKEMNKKTTRDPLKGVAGIILKFFAAALFGCLVSLILLLAIFAIGAHTFWDGWGPHLLWIIPILWGVLGIFWFEPMLAFASHIFEEFFRSGA